jgi:putative thioredoxin
MAGAVDLGALAAAREAEQRATAPRGSAPAGVVVDVTEATFAAEVIERSMTVPVVVDLWATWCQPCTVLSPILEALVAEDGGRWVLAKVDVDAEPRVAAAFQVQSIPTIVAVVKGQPLPLFQGALPAPQVRAYIDELLKAAEQAGVTGTVGEVAAVEEGDAGEPAEPPLHPALVAAFDAIDAGDWVAADAAYAALLAAEPGNPDARAGAALVGVLRRVDGVDPQAALASAAADPSDAAAASLAADVEAAQGDFAAAFARLVDLVRRSAGDERDAARTQLLGLFEVAGDDPAVAPARIALANALY